MSRAVFCLRSPRIITGPLLVILCRLYKPSRVSLVLYNSGIKAIVEKAQSSENPIILKILS
jgi:hypothetical protein